MSDNINKIERGESEHTSSTLGGTGDENPAPLASDMGPIARRTTTNASYVSAHSDRQDAALSHAFSRTSAFKDPLPPMGGGKPYPPMVKDLEAYKVEFDGDDDPLCPLNWTIKRKLLVGAAMVYPTTIVVWASSVYAPAAIEIKALFHVGTPVAVLGISLFVLGFATGPVVWGPMSEVLGRKLPMILSTFLFTCFNFWCATADHYYQLMLYRFFAGAFGSAPLAVVAAAFADILNTQERGLGMSVFSLCVIAGPMIAPVVGGYIAASYLHWRWTMYITGIMSALGFIMVVFFMEETFHPKILVGKAKELRERTKNEVIYAAHERIAFDLSTLVKKVLLLPIIMLFVEPILLLMSIYHGFIYGILYLCLEAVPIIFEKYGWKGGNIMLPYTGMFIGATLSNLLNIFVFEPKFNRDLKKSGRPVVPELRLPLMMVGSITFPIGIFLLCWTGAYHEHVHWIAPCFGCGFIGFGLIAIFLPVFNYIIDTYLFLAASAMAANTFLRSGMGAAFPIFASAMFNNLGTQWAGTLLGCLAVIMIPVPVLFYIFGPSIRKKSKYAPDIDELMAKRAAAMAEAARRRGEGDSSAGTEKTQQS